MVDEKQDDRVNIIEKICSEQIIINFYPFITSGKPVIATHTLYDRLRMSPTVYMTETIYSTYLIYSQIYEMFLKNKIKMKIHK